MAQYRLANYPKALAAFEQAARVRQEKGVPPHPVELGYLAMTHFKLDNRERAAAVLSELRGLLAQDQWMATVAAATWQLGEKEVCELADTEDRRHERDNAMACSPRPRR